MLLPSENRIVRFFEYLIGCVIAAVIGLAIAALGMSLGCVRAPAPTPAATQELADENEALCMRKAAKRITESNTCEEAWIKLVGLGIQDKRCEPYFKADGGLMSVVLVCDNQTSLSGSDDSTPLVP